MILFNSPSFEGRELEYIEQAVIGQHTSGNGPFTQRAEALLDRLHDGGTTLLTTSCTHALELCARLLDLEPGDEVIVPAYTFVSSASAFLLYGARPVFVDVRHDTLNLSPEAVEAAITPRTRAVCAVHYAGVGAEPEQLADLARRHDLTLIEDNAHGLFARYDGRPLGTFGALSTLSFHETKNITCGEGGAVHVNDAGLVERAEILREKGTDRSRFLRGEVDKYTWVDVGSSWAMADLLAAALTAQLEESDRIQSRRHHIWARYQDELASWAHDQGVVTPTIPAECEHSAHMYHLRLPSLEQRGGFIAHLRERGVQAVFHYQSLHLSRVGERLGGRAGQFPVTEAASDTLVRLPLHTSLSDDDQSVVLDAVRSFQVRS
ncbi:MAG: dTDP-4-amino-4,6-dideoxygalactose transaminase [Acidimicrobiales bacterium]